MLSFACWVWFLQGSHVRHVKYSILFGVPKCSLAWALVFFPLKCFNSQQQYAGPSFSVSKQLSRALHANGRQVRPHVWDLLIRPALLGFFIHKMKLELFSGVVLLRWSSQLLLGHMSVQDPDMNLHFYMQFQVFWPPALTSRWQLKKKTKNVSFQLSITWSWEDSCCAADLSLV